MKLRGLVPLRCTAMNHSAVADVSCASGPMKSVETPSEAKRWPFVKAAGKVDVDAFQVNVLVLKNAKRLHVVSSD